MTPTDPSTTSAPTALPLTWRELLERSAPHGTRDRELHVKLDVVLELLEEVTAEVRSVPLEEVRRRSLELARRRSIRPRSAARQFDLFEVEGPVADDTSATADRGSPESSRSRPSTGSDRSARPPGRRSRRSRRETDTPLYKLIMPV